MLLTINTVLLFATLILGCVPLILTRRFRQFSTKPSSPSDEAPFEPSTAVIIPCKGLDQGFGQNIQAFLNQEQDNISYYFIVATAEDPAYIAIQALLTQEEQNTGRSRSQLLVAGIENKRAQKLTNQLRGLEAVPKDIEVLVFLDSDLRPDHTFIKRLIAPLNQSDTGATSGFRWYHPPAPKFGSILRSTWNAGALPFLVDPKKNFAYGGAMAIKKSVFEKARIAAAWDRALSDDFPFTLGVRKLGLGIHFVPECIGVSYEESTIAQTVEFTNRQSIISRIYFPQLWWAAALGHSAANLLVFYGLYSLASWADTKSLEHLIGVSCLALLPMQMSNAYFLLRSVSKLLPKLADDIRKIRWYYVFFAPAASMLSLINTVYSMTTRKIIWRGIEYELISPNETRVISESNDP